MLLLLPEADGGRGGGGKSVCSCVAAHFSAPCSADLPIQGSTHRRGWGVVGCSGQRSKTTREMTFPEAQHESEVLCDFAEKAKMELYKLREVKH